MTTYGRTVNPKAAYPYLASWEPFDLHRVRHPKKICEIAKRTFRMLYWDETLGLSAELELPTSPLGRTSMSWGIQQSAYPGGSLQMPWILVSSCCKIRSSRGLSRKRL